MKQNSRSIPLARIIVYINFTVSEAGNSKGSSCQLANYLDKVEIPEMLTPYRGY